MSVRLWDWLTRGGDALLSGPLRLLRWLDRAPAWALLPVPLVLVGVFTALNFDPRVYPGGDNALYWALARSLAETASYRDLGAPGEPFETSIPWGFPLLLAAGMKVLPDGYPYLKVVPWLAMLGGFACLWYLLQHLLRGHRGLALLAIVVVALNQRLMVFASLLLTEAPYLLFSFGSLLAYEVWRQRAAQQPWGVAPAAALAAYAYLIRPAVVALVAAVLGALLLSRRWKALAVALLLVVVLDGSWHLRSLLVPSEADNLYLSYLVKQSKYQTDDTRVDAGGIVDRLTHNAEAYARGPLHRLTVGFKWRDRTRPSPVVLPTLLLIGLGFAFTLPRAGPLQLYVALYLGVILAWLPESVKDRYLAVVFPLLMAMALYGLWRALGWRWPRAAAWAVLVAFVSLLYLQGGRSVYKVPRYAKVREAYRSGDHERGRRKSHRSFVHMCEWARDHVPGDAILGARKPRLAYLYSGRKAVRTTFATDPDEVWGWLTEHDIDYVLMDRLDSQVEHTRTRMVPTRLAHPDHFTDVYVTWIGDRVTRFAEDPADLAEERERRGLYLELPRPPRDHVDEEDGGDTDEAEEDEDEESDGGGGPVRGLSAPSRKFE